MNIKMSIKLSRNLRSDQISIQSLSLFLLFVCRTNISNTTTKAITMDIRRNTQTLQSVREWRY